MTTISQDERRCYIDDSEGDTACVLDDSDPGACDEAASLHANGLCKTDCRFWRHPESVADEIATNKRQIKARVTIRADAVESRAAKLADEFEFMESQLQHFHENFVVISHGNYRRKKDVEARHERQLKIHGIRPLLK